ncbi:DUF2634 domain-containing protein [Paenibacillus sp. CAA11]|uniref:DUF2634 domain-containing protein n=1 Tax=Paenibacillus sp. CAA11 TaxID=1532905 RepID=UPI000D342D71|nr:DUF2634 domain-containing protein [Paenibacillus sp. CAA11]AWB45317.1 DUF2634 domain-containing protein [Paenibacillus sp. CAA11]
MPELFPEDMEFYDDLAASKNGDLTEPAAQPVPFGRSWRFDYDAGEFVLTPTGKAAVAAGTDAWLEWCRKVLHTPRYRHLIYSRSYGHELDELLGSGLTRAAYESEIRRMVEEALLADPRTASVDGFAFTWAGETCSFTCRVTSERDESASLSGSVVI